MNKTQRAQNELSYPASRPPVRRLMRPRRFYVSWLLALAVVLQALVAPVIPTLARNSARSTRPASAATPVSPQSNEIVTVFGPRRFTRQTGQPTSFVERFALPAGVDVSFTMRVQNGAPDGSKRLSSATVRLNGADVVKPSDLNQNVAEITRSGKLAQNNTLEVRLTSAPGSYLTITITATVNLPPSVSPSIQTVAPSRALQGQTLQVTLRGRNTHWLPGLTRASLGGEVAVGGAPFGELGPVVVTNLTTAIAEINISPTAALAPRTVRVTTSVTGIPGINISETATLTDGFTVAAATPPGATVSNVATIAGVAGSPGFANGPAANARFRNLASLAVGPDDTIYVADAGNNRIRAVREQANLHGALELTVSTLAGDGTAGFADGPAASARFNNPQGVAVDAGGAVIVADTDNNRIRRITPDGTVTTVAGDGTPGLQNGAGAQARFNAPRGVAVDSVGNIYVADTGNSSVRVISLSGEVRTAAGDGTTGSNDSPNARLNGLAGIAVDGDQIYIYIADTNNHRIRKLFSADTVITLSGAERGFADGRADQARFAEPSGLAIDGSGKIVVADSVNSLVRQVDPNLAGTSSPGAVATLAGTGDRGSADGTGNQAQFFLPRGIAVTQSSAIIVADTGNHTLRRILLPPSIISLAPAQARPLATVTISGERFDARAPERNIVRFKRSSQTGDEQTTARVVAATRRELVVVVPSDVATGPVTVQTDGGISNSLDFTLAAAPTPAITDFNPQHGPVGTNVTLMGAALRADTGETTVSFTGSNGARIQALVSYASETEVRTTVPNGAITGSIEVSNPWGLASTATPFTVDAQSDYQLTVAPSTASAVERSGATYIVSLSSSQSTFTQMGSLSATGLPAGIGVSFSPAQITAGASSTLSLNLANAALMPGSYPFTISTTAVVDGHDVVRTASATLNVIAGGQTTLAGRVLNTDSEPVIGATASLDGHTATTDAAGNFLLVGVTAGADRPLMIDGRTASAPNRTYPVINEPANILAGQANVVPYTFYLPPIDVQYEVEVVPGRDTAAGNARVPGLEMVIPAGANLRNRDGSPVTRVSITPLPVDRTPTPLPDNASTALVYTSQPGGALTNIAIPVVYPNLMGTDPGTRVELYAFNHDTVQWYVYGYGRVSSDGRTIQPEIDPATGRSYGLRDFSWHFPSGPPRRDPKKPDGCPKSRTGHPVDLVTGFKIESATDIAFGGRRGALALTRTYTSQLGAAGIIGRFGRGTRDNFDIRLTGTFQAGGAGRFITPEEQDGILFSYARTDADGTLIFTTTQSSSQVGNVIRRLTDGTLELRQEGGGDGMSFDETGRLIAMTDRNGNTTTFNYTGDDLTQITDPIGRSITLSYDGAHRITNATNPLGQEWKYGYDASGMLTSVTDPLNQVDRYSYDSNGRLVSWTDKRGVIAKLLTYDGAGRVQTQRYADGGTENYSYVMAGAVLVQASVTDALGHTRTMRFNAAGYVIETIDALGQSSRIGRDITTNLPTSTEGPCGCSESEKQFDSLGNVTNSSDRLGQTTQMEYEPNSKRLKKVTDQLGHTLSFTYDARGNLATATDTLNQVTSYEYDEFGLMTAQTDPLGHTTHYEYDYYGNQTAQIDPLDHRTEMEYDELGRLVATIDSLGRRSSVIYDALGRIISTTDAASTTSRFAYDANNNLVQVTDALGHKQKIVYDNRNRLVSTTDALGRESKVQYNLGSEVVKETSPTGRTQQFTYDARGQMATMTDPLGGKVTYVTDSRGHLISLTDPRGHTTTFTYDELYRLVGMRDPLGRASSTKYDVLGNIIETVDRLGQHATYAYDAGNRPVTITLADAVINYTYDRASRLVRIDDSQSGSVEWSYDDAGRRLSETTPNGVVSFAYDETGDIVSMTAADQPAVTYSYDQAGRLQSIAQNGQSFTYNYDAVSRIVKLQRPNGIETSYSYDVVNRLKRLTHSAGPGQTIEDYRFTYNLNDEIAGVTSLGSAALLPTARNNAVADAANKVAQSGASSFTFDERGATVAKTDAQGATNYRWDARERLTQATLPNGQTVSYSYDALGRLSSRTAGGATTSFLYNGGDVVVDRLSDGSKVSYLNGIGIDNKLRQTSAQTGPLYYLQDQVGSTVALTDETGSVVERMQYEPFGASTGSTLTRYGYTGRERDSQTGLMYYRARWYDPQQGRFITEDPAGFAGGLNKYSYVSNNPVSKTDPMGLYEIDVHYYLTYYLARKTGCFTESQAHEIANEDQKTDENKDTMPGRGTTEKQRMQNRVFHALHPGAAEGKGSPLLWAGAMNESGGYQWFGRYLHYLQDTFSHAGYHDDEWGHSPPNTLLGDGTYGDHATDKTASDPAKARRMAGATWRALLEYIKAKKCDCDPKWDNSWWNEINDFINIDTDDPRWSTIDANERAIDNPGLGDPAALTRKRRILGLPDRYSGLW